MNQVEATMPKTSNVARKKTVKAQKTTDKTVVNTAGTTTIDQIGRAHV